MRSLKFILSALAILLAGALAAGFAARAVAAPRTGEVVNAGVVPIPSVLGQTAEEALFYPWSLYDMQALFPVAEDQLAPLRTGDMLSAAAAFEVFEVEGDMEALVKSQVWSGTENASPNGGHLVFLKDFPALLTDGISVSLDYALSTGTPLSVSWLVRPRTEADLTEEQRQAALDKVREDLAGLLRYMRSSGGDHRNDLMQLIENFGVWFSDMDMSIFLDWLETLIEILHNQYSGDIETKSFDEYGQTVEDSASLVSEQDLSALSLEELLALGNGAVDIQLISTPRQVVVLFSWPGSWTFGAYYDVQLERYSGFGLSS